MPRISACATASAVLMASALSVSNALAQTGTHQGSLDSKDTIDCPRGDDYLADAYTFEVTEGQQVTIDLNTDDFDCYLYAVGPDGQELSNDDFESTSRSYLEIWSPTPGTWTAYVTSFSSGDTGDYTVEINVQEAPELTEIFSVESELDGSLPRTHDGRCFESHTVDLEEGQHVVIDLASDGFDTYLSVVGSEYGDHWYNDDVEGADGTNSQVRFTVPATGTYTLFAMPFSSYFPPSGSYTLSVQTTESE